jgi:peptidoglycan/LPS O-acetylase OafA/YrhL
MSPPLQGARSSSIRRAADWLAGKLARVTSTHDYIPEIDGLRFVAVLFVLIFHSAESFTQMQARSSLPRHWTHGQSVILATMGVFYSGVQIFFVISGLVVALPFARHALQGAPKPNIGKYFMRRLTRIEPPYILGLLAMYYILHQYHRYLPDLLAGLVYMHYWIFGTNNPVNQVTWTLEIEVVFYLLAPWLTLIYRVPGRTARWMVQILLLGAYSYFVHERLIPFGPARLDHTIVTALPFFQAGILLADLYVSGLLLRSGSLWWDAPAVMGLMGMLYCQSMAWRYYWLTPLMLMLMVAGGIKGRITNWLLRLRPVTLIGGMCYSLYLWHMPIIAELWSSSQLIPRRLSDFDAIVIFCLLAVPLIIVVTIPIYYFTEKPFMNGPGSRFIERVLRSAYSGLQRQPAIVSSETV